MQLDEEFEITLILDGSLGSLDAPRLPAQNAVIDGAPSVSSEFQWINGATSRRKVYRYRAHAIAAGIARIGPVTLRDPQGVQVTFPTITISVTADASTMSNDPAQIMRDLVASNRDPIFVIAQADKASPFEGEEVIVSWTLYTGATVQRYNLGEIPKLQDFWTEELEVRNDQSAPVMLGNIPAQMLTIRRAALFPLRSGPLTVGSMTVHASVIKRMNTGDPFGLFEGVVTDVRRRTSPVIIDVKPIPPGSPVIAVSNILNLLCNPPAQKNGGPVVFDVTLSGRANLRSTQPPGWVAPVDANVQIVDRGTAMTYPVSRDFWMTRRWRYLLFPSRSGDLSIPALSVRFLTTTGERREARCEARTLNVVATANEDSSSVGPRPSAASRRGRRPYMPVAGGIAVTVILIAVAVPRVRRSARLRKRVASLLRDTPTTTRESVESDLVARDIDPFQLIKEPSDRGDAFRAFRSIIDERIAATDRDIAHRVRDLLVALESVDAQDAKARAAQVRAR